MFEFHFLPRFAVRSQYERLMTGFGPHSAAFTSSTILLLLLLLLLPCPCSPMVKPLGRHVQYRDVRSGRGSIRASARARPPTKKNYFK